MDDDDDRQSDPFGSRDPFDDNEGGAERPMSYLAAAGFTFGTTFLFFFLVALVVSVRPSAATDLVTKFACQVVSTLLGLFFILRFYAPEASIRDLLGVRATSFGFFPIAALLGAAVQVPANALYDLITRRFPTEGKDEALYEELAGGTPKRIAMFMILALLGPLIEEVFFRGALFRPLRRRYVASGVVLATSVFFAASHLEWQMMAPIGIVGLALGILRSSSGSLLPGLVMHGVFNGITLYSLYAHPPGPDGSSTSGPMPLSLMIGGTAATAVLLLLSYGLGARSATAQEAQRKDEA